MSKTITLEGFVVDEDAYNNFVDFVARGNSDIFSTDYIGYWAFGYDVDNTFLLFEQGEEGQPMHDISIAAATAFRAKQPLPENWHVVDDEFAKKVVIAGLRQYGQNFLDAYDAGMLDCAVQLALFGKLEYA